MRTENHDRMHHGLRFALLVPRRHVNHRRWTHHDFRRCMNWLRTRDFPRLNNDLPRLFDHSLVFRLVFKFVFGFDYYPRRRLDDDFSPWFNDHVRRWLDDHFASRLNNNPGRRFDNDLAPRLNNDARWWLDNDLSSWFHDNSRRWLNDNLAPWLDYYAGRRFDHNSRRPHYEGRCWNN